MKFKDGYFIFKRTFLQLPYIRIFQIFLDLRNVSSAPPFLFYFDAKQIFIFVTQIHINIIIKKCEKKFRKFEWVGGL